MTTKATAATKATKPAMQRMHVRLNEGQAAYVNEKATNSYRTPQQVVQMLLDQAILADGYDQTVLADGYRAGSDAST